jgi:hypothetical protein
MGANFDYNIIPDPDLKMTDKEIGVAAEGIFEQSAYENGHGGYSGSLAEKTGEGVTIHRDIQFNDEHEASRYVSDTLDNDKWGAADAVAIIGKGWFVGGFCSS